MNEKLDRIENIIDYFYNNENNVAKISIDEVKDVVNLAMIVTSDESFSDSLQFKAYALLCEIAAKDILSIGERWTLYWILQHKSFVSTKFDQFDAALDKVYSKIYFYVEKEIPATLFKKNSEEAEDKPVVIVTSQFLSEKHAPTRRVLDYSYTIQRKLGIPVVIINDAGLNLKQYSYMDPNFSFNYVKQYTDMDKIPYKDTEFAFYQVSKIMPDLQEIANVIYNIKLLSPRLVLNVGTCSLTSDLCRHFTKTATIPCSTSIPRSMAENLILCRELRDTDKEKLDRLQPWQRLIESVFNYIMPDDSTLRHYMREDFNIAQDEWLIVSAGNRMQDEMDDEFLSMADQILGKLPNSHFMIIGEISDQKGIQEKFINREKLHFAGQLADGSQAIRLADVYIQPTRKGGGRAAFEAMYYGVPVITTMYGDTWDVCGKQFEVESYQKMAERLECYYYDKALYNNIKLDSRNRALKLENMKDMFENLFSKIDLEFSDSVVGVDDSLFYNIFKTQQEKSMTKLENTLNNLLSRVYVVERRIRDNEWANVFNNTVIGSEWFTKISLSPGRSALGYPGLYALYRSIDEFHPQNILELGLGQSTRVIGAYAKYFNAEHYIVEHDKSWIQFFLSKHVLKENTKIVCLERKEDIYKGKWLSTQNSIKYYDKFAENLAGNKFDFIFIDGPQGSNEYSRVDITEILPECLAASFVIMIDDSERSGERNTINKICGILNKFNISFYSAEYDGLKNTCLIVSPDLVFLCSL